MFKFNFSAVISRPVEEVFAFAANYENDHQWRPDIRPMRYITPEPVGVGSRAVEVTHVLGRRLEATVEIIEYQPNKKVVAKVISWPVPVLLYREFEPVPQGTRLTGGVEGDLSKVFLFRLLWPLFAPIVQRQFADYAQKLKQIIESGMSANTI